MHSLVLLLSIGLIEVIILLIAGAMVVGIVVLLIWLKRRQAGST